MSLNEQFKQQQGAFKQSAETAQSGDLITGVSVPVSLMRNGAKLRMQIHLNPSVLDNPQALNAALDQIESVFDLDTWQPSGGNSGGGFKSGGGGFQRGGYGNGYSNRRY